MAVDANTGKYLWHFQLVHHDVWDYDLPAQPVLADLVRDGEKVDVREMKPGEVLAGVAP